MNPDEFDAWPKCAVPACPLKCCRRLRSRYCWPHTPGTPEEAGESLAEEIQAEERADQVVHRGS
jgi:hypothetical protein